MKKIKRIFIATDFSDTSKEAFNQAVQLARQMEATLLLAHVIEPIDMAASHLEPFGFLELRLQQRLDRMVQPVRRRGSWSKPTFSRGSRR